MSKINFENIDSKIEKIMKTENWQRLQGTFNQKSIIICFGHGGNMAVADHATIDIARLSDKTAISPGSGIHCTSLISDFSFEEWLMRWLEILFRQMDLSKILVIGLSCSVGSKSSQAIINALEYSMEQGVETCLISARHKKDMNPKLIQVINDSIYYHTSEVLSLALFYQLIHGYKNSDLSMDLVDCPPPIKSKPIYVSEKGCSNCDYGELDHSFCPPSEVEVKHTPPGMESQMNNLAIDFDGVIHNFNRGYYDGTCYGEPIEGSLEALKVLSQKYNIIIFSSKCLPDRPLVDGKTGKELIIEWLQKHDVLKYVKDVTHEKIRARYYIDDKGIFFHNNWDEIIDKIS